MNSLSLTTIVVIILAATVTSTIAQIWYSPCVARGASYKCPGYLRTEKLQFPECQGVRDQYACFDDRLDRNGGWRRGSVTRSIWCDERSVEGAGCPPGFRRTLHEPIICRGTIARNTIGITCTA